MVKIEKISSLRELLDKDKEVKNTTTQDIKEALALALLNLIDELKKATSYSSKKELKAISFLQTDKIFSMMLEPFVFNKKFYKRKYTKELMKIIRDVAKAIGNIEATEKEGFLKGIFNKER